MSCGYHWGASRTNPTSAPGLSQRKASAEHGMGRSRVRSGPSLAGAPGETRHKLGVRGAGWVVMAALACGGRNSDFDASFDSTPAVGLNRAVVIGDDPLARVVVLTSDGAQSLSATELPVGQNVVRMQPDVSGDRLLVLSSGVQPRLQTGDELPSLSLLDTSGTPRVVDRYELSEPFSALTLDPEGRWVVLSGAADNFVTNPNQLVLINLEIQDFVPVTKTIRSFGAAPERFSFTEPLDVPGGPHRFLIVETRQDIALVNLDDLSQPEITVGLPQTPAGNAGKPLQVVVHPGDALKPNDARLAIRLENDPNLVLVNFAEAEAGSAAFNLTLNLVDVGRPPAALEFVNTDGGLRLAALVPDRLEATLVDPDTTQVERVVLPTRFDQLRRITEGAVAEADEGDVALLWSPNASRVAFWSLGRTDDRAFRSVDVLDLAAPVSQVFDVPGDTLGHRKLLQASDARFFVLDLQRRQSFPMLSSGSLSLAVAPDGLRAWAYAAGSTRFAKVDLSTLEPTSLQIERPISQIFDIASGTSGERTLIALHGTGGRGATVLNALDPDTAATRFFPGLLFGGQP